MSNAQGPRKRVRPPVTITLDPDLVDALDRRAADHSPPSRSAAARELLRAGLAAETRRRAKTPATGSQT